MTRPRISIVTPSFNQGPYLERAIQSVVEQSYPNLEYLIVDGGSTDDSVPVIKRYEKSLTFWESEKDRGVGHALNKGFARSTGEIMGWLNADDVYLPNVFHIVSQIFTDYPAIQWLTSGSINISGDDRLFVIQTSRKWFSRWTQWFNRSLPPQHCTFWRRDLWARAGGYVVERSRYMDCELWLRFHEHARLFVVDSIFGAWRLHPAAYSRAHLGQFYRNIDEAHRPYFEKYLKSRFALKLLVPLMRWYFQTIDRGILSRVFFELWLRQNRLLTFDLNSGRFVLKRTGWLPKPWPLTIEAPVRELSA